MAFREKDRPSNHESLDNEILMGKVVSHEVTEDQANVRVLYADRGNMISKPIPVLQRGALGMRSMDVPAIGSNVMVNRSSSGLEEGFVMGTLYTTENPPPQTDPNKSYTEFGDKSTFEFNPATGGGMTLKLTSALDVSSAMTIKMTATGEITITSSGKITLKGTEIVLDTPKVSIPSGDIEQTGNFNQTGVHTDSIGRHDV